MWRKVCHGAENCDGSAESRESDRSGVEDQGEHHGFESREAQHDEQRTRNRDRCAESSDAFQKCTEAKTDDNQNDAAIPGQSLDYPVFQGVEAA